MRSRRAGESWSGRLKALETVAVETPSSRARSFKVMRRVGAVMAFPGRWRPADKDTDPGPRGTGPAHAHAPLQATARARLAFRARSFASNRCTCCGSGTDRKSVV